jgi:large subunit ribosomal protein L10
VPKQYKLDTVASVKEKLAQSKSIVVADYRGLTVGEVTDLRNRLRKEGVELRVVKNRLAKIALKEANMDPMDAHLKGMTAIAFGLKDPVSPAKVLSTYAKENEKLKLIAGQMDNQVLDLAGINELAQLPSREVLLSRMLGSLTSPVQKLAYGLHQTVAKVVYAVDAVGRQKAEQQ